MNAQTSSNNRRVWGAFALMIAAVYGLGFLGDSMIIAVVQVVALCLGICVVWIMLLPLAIRRLGRIVGPVLWSLSICVLVFLFVHKAFFG